MKRILSVIMAIVLMAMSAAALADGNGNTQGRMPNSMPAQGQTRGPMTGGPNGGNRQDGQMPNGQAPSGERPADAPELPSGEKPDDAPDLPSGEKPTEMHERPNSGKPGMIDFDAMVTCGVISQETCDKIKAYIAEHKPAGMPEMNGQEPDGEKQDGLSEMNGEKPSEGQTRPEMTNNKKPEGMPGTNGQTPEAPAMGGLLKDLLDAEVITRAEYDALVEKQTADAA